MSRSKEPRHPRGEQDPVVRCAIYTRKSTEEGLEQEFNSLEAQRDAGEAYVASQKSEGWVCLPERYDDGGFSGGTMDRPALKRLLANAEAGKIDCIVVYKVDRLSRSLLDFSRIMEVLDRYGVSFVSVTQQFNTATSIGRLLLNVLLSFAQYEREIIGERTRDKMSAARRRGKWVGGMPILGYDVRPEGGGLVINEAEAERVRAIFDLYLAEESLLATAKELARRGWKTKGWVTREGRVRTGRAFDKTALHNLLRNATYAGKVRYQKQMYEGEHAAIVSVESWVEVQRLLRRNGMNGGQAVRNRHGALLQGLLRCDPCGTAMVHTYSRKGEKRYRYYVCSRAMKEGWQACPTKSLPAAEVESFVLAEIRKIGQDPRLVKEITDRVRAGAEERMEALRRERVGRERDLRRAASELSGLARLRPGDADGKEAVTARLADLQDRIRAAEEAVRSVEGEIGALEREMVSDDEISVALARFDPVWQQLTMREQSRLIHLLVEKVAYSRAKGTLAVTFRPVGIKAFANGGPTP